MPDLPVWGVTVSTPSAARDLIPRAPQVRAIARVRSRAAFARALIAAGLTRDSEATAGRWVRVYGSETRNATELATAVTEGQVYIRPSTDWQAPLWAWPPE